MKTSGIEAVGVREYSEEFPVVIESYNGREVIVALCQAGHDGTRVDLLDLIEWLKKNRSEILK